MLYRNGYIIWLYTQRLEILSVRLRACLLHAACICVAAWLYLCNSLYLFLHVLFVYAVIFLSSDFPISYLPPSHSFHARLSIPASSTHGCLLWKRRLGLACEGWTLGAHHLEIYFIDRQLLSLGHGSDWMPINGQPTHTMPYSVYNIHMYYIYIYHLHNPYYVNTHTCVYIYTGIFY